MPNYLFHFSKPSAINVVKKVFLLIFFFVHSVELNFKIPIIIFKVPQSQIVNQNFYKNRIEYSKLTANLKRFPEKPSNIILSRRKYVDKGASYIKDDKILIVKYETYLRFGN